MPGWPPAARLFAAHLGIGHARGAFDDEAKIIIDLRCKRRVLAGGQRPPEGAIHTDGAQQWVLVIGGQPLLGQYFFGIGTVPDQTFPTRIGPRGGSHAQIGGQLGCQIGPLRSFGC